MKSRRHRPFPRPARRPHAGAPTPPAAAGQGTHGLARVLSRLGLVSRSEAWTWIEAGRVTVDGQAVRDPERRTDPRRERIAVDGAPVRSAKKLYYVMNKPVGVVTTYRDPQGRKTVYDVLREALAPGTEGGAPPTPIPWLFPVGRLDAMTLGLLVFTNDTEFGNLLTDEAAAIPKTYEVKARGRMEEAAVDRMRRGVTLDDGTATRPAECRVQQANEGSTWLEIVLREGKNRQIRRMCQAVGHEVVKLRRVRIGPIELGDLKAGAVRPLTAREIEGVRQTAQEKGQNPKSNPGATGAANKDS